MVGPLAREPVPTPRAQRRSREARPLVKAQSIRTEEVVYAEKIGTTRDLRHPQPGGKDGAVVLAVLARRERERARAGEVSGAGDAEGAGAGHGERGQCDERVLAHRAPPWEFENPVGSRWVL